MLNIGDTISLEQIGQTVQETYRCRLVERTEDTLFIDYPVNEKTGKTIFLMNGAKLKASFISQNNSVYSFETVVLGRAKQQIPMIKLSFPGKQKLVRVQRRQYVRIETSVDIAVHPIKDEFTPFVTVTNDISAGGASIYLLEHAKVVPGMELFIWFVLPMLSGEYQYLKIKSRLIRIIEASRGEKKKASIQFIELKETETQMITKFCFERQLTKRKME